MKRSAAILIIVFILGSASCCAFSQSNEDRDERYSATAIALSDFSMKIIAYHQKQGISLPEDFNTTQFFSLLERIYPDQSRVQSVRDGYRVSVRPLDGGYSVMLCDQQTDRKIMEDLSCHLNRVEIRSWEGASDSPCAYEVNWEPLCEK